MMISIDLYRARIGMWDLFCGKKRKVSGCSKISSNFRLITFCLILLLIAGDIHPNPGPTVKKKSIDICHINSRSLYCIDKETRTYLKFDEIVQYAIHDMKADILCLSETWLDGSISDSDVLIPNYTIFRNDRSRHGGGVAIYVSD